MKAPAWCWPGLWGSSGEHTGLPQPHQNSLWALGTGLIYQPHSPLPAQTSYDPFTLPKPPHPHHHDGQSFIKAPVFGSRPRAFHTSLHPTPCQNGRDSSGGEHHQPGQLGGICVLPQCSASCRKPPGVALPRIGPAPSPLCPFLEEWDISFLVPFSSSSEAPGFSGMAEALPCSGWTTFLQNMGNSPPHLPFGAPQSCTPLPI